MDYDGFDVFLDTCAQTWPEQFGENERNFVDLARNSFELDPTSLLYRNVEIYIRPPDQHAFKVIGTVDFLLRTGSDIILASEIDIHDPKLNEQTLQSARDRLRNLSFYLRSEFDPNEIRRASLFLYDSERPGFVNVTTNPAKELQRRARHGVTFRATLVSRR